MKRLKNILQSNLFLLFLFFIALIVSIYKFNHKDKLSKYSNEEIIIGYISDINIDGNKLKLEVKAKEKIIGIYFIKNKKEKELISKNYHYGDYVRLKGILSVPSKNTNFNLFNYQNYLLSKKIYYIFNINSIVKLKNNKNIIYSLKNIIVNRIRKIDYNGYLLDFIIGNNSNIDSDITNNYRILGISHLLAISGMHITLLATIIFKILNKIIKKESLINIIISLFLIIYIIITNYSASIIRASLIYILLIINKKYELGIKTIRYLIIMFLFMIIFNSFYIYDIGFLFSFIISFYLILFSKVINNYHNYFTKIFITSLISFLVSIPILISNFYSINLLSPFINVIMVPFVSIIIYPLSLIVFIFPIFRVVFIFMINILEFFTMILSNITIGIIILPKVPIIVIIIYYLIITIILINLYSKKYYKILYLVVILIIHSNINKLYPYSVITALDVGQGDSIFIQLPFNKRNILIDTGGLVSFNNEEWKKAKSNNSITINITIPYLKSIGVKELDYLILTHGDFDHMGEAINLVNNFKVEKVIFNCGEFNELEQTLIKVLDKKKIPYYSCIKELNIDNNKLYFLQTKEYDNENDNSNVIYTENNGYKFMFMGDAGIGKEKDILDKYNISNIDVLKVGHHGSKTSSNETFINEINPKYSIISVGKNNRYGHPNREVLNTLENSKIYRTDLDGSVIFKIKNNKLKIETCSP